VKAIAIMIVLAIGAASVALSAGAQQPTPASPHYPNWCSDVPESPPPPNFDTGHPGHWAAVRNMCMNAKTPEMGCGNICRFAEDLWRMQKSGRLNQPDTLPSPTDKPQGPFPQPGRWVWIYSADATCARRSYRSSVSRHVGAVLAEGRQAEALEGVFRCGHRGEDCVRRVRTIDAVERVA